MGRPGGFDLLKVEVGMATGVLAAAAAAAARHARGAEGRRSPGDQRDRAPAAVRLSVERRAGDLRTETGLSRGGRTTKLHAAVDERGRPRRLILDPGHRGEALLALDLVGDFAPSLYLVDVSYDSRAIRARIIASGGSTR